MEAISALSALQLCNEDDVNSLLEIFKEETSDDIIAELYYYLFSIGKHEQYIEFILNRAKSIKLRDKFIMRRLDYPLAKILQDLKEVSSIIQVLIYLSDDDNSFHGDDDIFKYCCREATKHYNSGKSEILDTMLQILLIIIEKWNNKKEKDIKNFFKETNTIFEAYTVILNNCGKRYSYIHLVDFLDEKSECDFAEKYKNNDLKDKYAFIEYVRRMNKSSKNYDEFIKLIEKVDNEKIETITHIDTTEYETQGKQAYFDLLFDETAFVKYIESHFRPNENRDDMLKKCSDLRKEEYRSDSFKPSKEFYCYNQIVHHISSSLKNEKTVQDYIQFTQNPLFFINQIYQVLNNYSDIEVSKEQESFIFDFCENSLKDMDVLEEITYLDTGRIEYSYRVAFTAFFINKFDFDFEENYLSKLIYIPNYFYEEKSDYHKLPQYIFNKYSQFEIKNQVIENINKYNLLGKIAIVHINFCKEYQLRDAADLARKVITNPNCKDYDKRIPIEYLIDLYGEDAVVDEFLPNDDETIVKILSNSVLKYHSKIEEALINLNKNSEDEFYEVEKLISMNSRYGLELYLNYCKNNNQIPDYTESNNICDLTESIREINDIGLIDILCDLILVSHRENFKDQKILGLYHSLYTAFKNLSAEHYDIVEEKLNEVIEKHSDNQDICQYCNNIIYDGNLIHTQAGDLPYTDEEIEKLIS